MSEVKSMKYFIVGYMASGKSTFGKELAKDKGLPFLDLDECVESREGRSISEIFAKEGEEYFRKREREILHEICNEADEFVLATGGGTPCFFDNMDYMNQEGTTLVIVDRLKRQRADRPLLAMYSDDELEFFVREHLESRLSFYLKAKEQV